MKTVPLAERIEYCRPEDLPGVEIIRADHTTKCLRTFHQTYMVNTNLIGGGDPRKYGKALYRGKIQTAHDGDTVLAEPGEIQAVRFISSPASFRALFLPPDLIQTTAREMGMAGPRPHFKMGISQHPLLYKIFKSLHQSLENRGSALERQSRLANGLRILMETAVETNPAPSPRGKEHKAVRRAVEFLRENWADNISLESLAKAAKLSRFHLIRVFSLEIGLPPHAYQILLRVTRVREMLKRGMSPTRAAAETGFADQSHMNRHFKNMLGVTPHQYIGHHHAIHG